MNERENKRIIEANSAGISGGLIAEEEEERKEEFDEFLQTTRQCS